MAALENLRKDMRGLADNQRAKALQGFFKTGPGEYGEGDIFLGVTVPQSRTVAKNYIGLGMRDLETLLKSPIHEERLVALLILVEKFQVAEEKKPIVIFYLSNAKSVNNWDLVDLSSHKILGEWIAEDGRDASVLYDLAKSKNLWERRIAIVSTFAFIGRGIFGDTLKIAEMLIGDDQDLIHKAVGWALREVGKREPAVLEKFLDKNYRKMPRTMLRYAIERLPEKTRKAYMEGSA